VEDRISGLEDKVDIIEENKTDEYRIKKHKWYMQ
jgi:hypothetical protein